MIRKKKSIASQSFIWLKVSLMALGFLGVLKVMTWLKQSPQENVISASSPSFKIKVDSKLQEVQEDPSSSAASGDNHSNPKN